MRIQENLCEALFPCSVARCLLMLSCVCDILASYQSKSHRRFILLVMLLQLTKPFPPKKVRFYTLVLGFIAFMTALHHCIFDARFLPSIQ